MHESTSSATNGYAISVTEHKQRHAKTGVQIQFKPHSILYHFNFPAIQLIFMDTYYIYKHFLDIRIANPVWRRVRIPPPLLCES
jgi:hypothetical protein